MEEVGISGLLKLSEQSIVATVLVLIIVALLWDRSRILKSLDAMTNSFIQAIKENGDNYAKVVNENTKAAIELTNAIRSKN